MRSENGEILANTKSQFIWDDSHLVQEIDYKNNRTYSYIYSHPNSYKPLAQLEFAKDSMNYFPIQTLSVRKISRTKMFNEIYRNDKYVIEEYSEDVLYHEYDTTQ